MRLELILCMMLMSGAGAYLLGCRASRLFGRQAAPAVASAPAVGRDPSSLFLALTEPCDDWAPVIFAICEIEGFEMMRRHLGPRPANALIRRFADVIAATLPDAAMGRLNRATIEFAWLPGTGADIAARLADVLEQLPRSHDIEGFTLDLRPRIAFLESNRGTASEEAFERIEAALARPVDHRADLIAIDPPSTVSDNERLEFLCKLSLAIAEDRLELHYQPKLDCRSETITSAEALLRWTDPALGTIGADRMISIAEETGLIRQLTGWVIDRALRDLRALQACGLTLPVYVNISGALLPDEDFAAQLLEKARGMEGLIGLEITETAVIHDPARALANLNAFRAAGFSIAIDDYGSGLSSLAYLKQLPAHELKIDRLFISGLTTSHRDPLLVRSSIDLAHALEMKVTAEGVDSPMALSLLTIMGCDMVQGYLVSPPLPLDELIAFLRRESHVDHIQPGPPAMNFARG